MAKINTNISSLKTKKDTVVNARDKALAADQARWDQQIKASRSEWERQRQVNFTKLEAKASTAVQVAAVKTYETTLTNAVNTRRSANDAARTNFKNGVASALADQQATINSQTAALSTAVSNAATTAQASCEANPSNSSAIHSTFVASLKTARESFVNDRKADAKLGDTIKQLEQTRNAAIKTANTNFQATAKAARTTLKNSFGNSSI